MFTHICWYLRLYKYIKIYTYVDTKICTVVAGKKSQSILHEGLMNLARCIQLPQERQIEPARALSGPPQVRGSTLGKP